MLIITGCGRCGTSLLARFCYEVGAKMDGKAAQLPGKGDKYIMGWEDPDVCAINQQILDERLVNAPVADRLKLVEQMRAIDRDVVKDPRFVFADAMLEWVAARKDIRLLILFRDFKDIVSSVDMNREYFCGKWRHNHEQFYRDSFARFMWIVASMRIPFRLLFFPDFLDDYYLVWEALRSLGFKFDAKSGRQVWDRLVDRNQVVTYSKMAADGHTINT